MDLGKKYTPIFIGIAGGSASGKTSIAKRISDNMNRKVPIISMDWFYRPLKDKSQGPTHNWDDPNSFNVELIVSTIQGWKDGAGQWTPRHDYANYEQIDNVEFIEPTPVMIFEGLYAFHHPKLSELMDFKVFVDCDVDSALGRRLRRDVVERGYSVEEILDRYLQQVKPAFDQWILPLRKKADVIIYNGEKALGNLKVLDMLVVYIVALQQIMHAVSK